MPFYTEAFEPVSGKLWQGRPCQTLAELGTLHMVELAAEKGSGRVWVEYVLHIVCMPACLRMMPLQEGGICPGLCSQSSLA